MKTFLSNPMFYLKRFFTNLTGMQKILPITLILFLMPVELLAQGHVTVILYHRFDDGTSISIPMKKFRRQMKYLQKNNYHFVDLKEMKKHFRTGKPFPKKSIMITVDDGYESTYTEAYPYLKKQGIPWVLYVYTESINKGYGSALTWEMTREMAKNGVPVENHSYSHGKFTKVKDKNDTWIRREILTPHKTIKQKTGHVSTTFGIPYGMYDRELISILKNRTDYEFIFSSDPGPVDPTDKPFLVNRFGVNTSTSMEEFKKKVRRLPLSIKNISHPPGTRFNGSPPDTITIYPRRKELLDGGPINVFISEFGAVKWEKTAEGNGLIVEVPEGYSRHWNRLIITIYDKKAGRYRYYSQVLIFD